MPCTLRFWILTPHTADLFVCGLPIAGLGQRWNMTRQLGANLRCRLCQTTFCRDCDAAVPHAPATCQMMKDWESKGGVVYSNEEDVKNRALIAKIR